MPSREIRTTLAIDGDKKFALAMKDAAREMRVMESELKLVAAEFKSTDDAQKYYSERSRILKDEVEHQKETVRALTKAVEESKEVFGKAARETNGYRIELNNAKSKLEDLKRASEQADKEVEEFGRDSKKVGRQIADGIGDGVEEAADEMDGMFDRISDGLESLKGMAGVQIAGQVGEFVINAAQALGSFVAVNADLNRQIAIAQFNVEQTGQNWDKINALAIRATAVTGDYEAALEAVSHLSQVGFDDVGLFGAAVDAIIGVSIRSQNALNFEGLAESFRESIKTKTPAGQYAEAIEAVLGEAAVDEVTKAFEGTKSTEELIEVALGYLTRAGAQTTTRDWMAENAELVDYTTKTTELTLAWAELAEELTPAVTEVISWLKTAVNETSNFVKEYKTARQGFVDLGTEIGETAGAAAAGILPESVRDAGKQTVYLDPTTGKLTDLETGEEVKGGLEQLAEDWTKFWTDFQNGWNLWKEAGKTVVGWVETGIADTKEWLSDPDGEVANFKTELENMWSQWEEAGQAAIDWIKNALETAFGWVGDLIDFFSYKETDPIYMENVGNSLDDLKAELGSFDDTRKRTAAENQAIFDKYDDNDLGVQKLYQEIDAMYRMLGMDFGVTLKTETEENGRSAGMAAADALSEAETSAETAGKNFGIAFGNGILRAQPEVMRNLAMMLGGINSVLNQPAGVPSYSVFSGAGGGNPNQTASNRGMAVLEIDGHTAGRLLYGGVSEEGARRTRTMITVG